jgi:hypothetical protein
MDKTVLGGHYQGVAASQRPEQPLAAKGYCLKTLDSNATGQSQ